MARRTRSLAALVLPLAVAACGLEIVGTFQSAGPGPVVEAGVSLLDGAPGPGDRDAEAPDGGCVGEECPCDLAQGQCPDAGTPVPLTVKVQGSSTPAVVTAIGTTIACPGVCTSTVLAGADVQLTAQPSPDESLVGWSVASCGRNPTCTVKVNGPLTVTATFAPLKHYVHETGRLWSVNPVTGATTSIAQLANCIGTAYDLALDRTGKAFLVTNNALVTVNLTNGICSNAIGTLDVVCVGLTIMPDPAAPQNDVLLGGCGDKLVRLDKATAAKTEIGVLGGNFVYSGDIAWVPGSGLYATVASGGGKDAVVRVDPATGVMIGTPKSTGEDNLYGIAHRGGKLLLFGESKVFTYDLATEVTTFLAASTFSAFGAATGP